MLRQKKLTLQNRVLAGDSLSVIELPATTKQLIKSISTLSLHIRNQKDSAIGCEMRAKIKPT